MFDQLPPELICLIFSYLDYNDLFHLKPTCKRFNYLLSPKNLTKLVVFIENYAYEGDMFYTNEPFGRSFSLRIPNSLRVFKSTPFRQTFRHVRKLILCYDDNDYDHRLGISCQKLDNLKLNFNKDVNYFKELEHLEINCVGLLEGCMKFKNLKVCHLYARQDSPIKIDCPNLIALSLTKEVQPELVNSNNIKYLKLNCVKLNFLENFYLDCQHLETISFSRFEEFSTVLELIKETKFVGSLQRLQLNFHRFNKDEFRELLTLKQSLRRLGLGQLNVQFYEKQIDCESFTQIAKLMESYQPSIELWSLDSMKMKFIAQNRLLFNDLLSSVREIDFNQDVQISSQLIHRLKSLVSMTLRNRVIDDELFLTMLVHLKKLKNLTLVSSKLSQESYDLMPTYFSNLRMLIISRSKLDNLDFVVHFKNLKNLAINKIGIKFKKHELEFLISQTPSLRTLQIIGQRNIGILIDRPLKFILQIRFLKTLTFRCLHNLLNHLYHDKSL